MTTESNMTPAPADTAALVERIEDYLRRDKSVTMHPLHPAVLLTECLSALAETQARLAEDEQLIIALWRYGELRPVEGVLYPEGSHRALLDKARKVYERQAARTSPPAAAAERGETT